MKHILYFLLLPCLIFSQSNELCDSIYISDWTWQESAVFNESEQTLEPVEILSIQVDVDFTNSIWLPYAGFVLVNEEGDTIATELLDSANNVYGLGSGISETRTLFIINEMVFPFSGTLHLVNGWFAGKPETICSWPFIWNDGCQDENACNYFLPYYPNVECEYLGDDCLVYEEFVILNDTIQVWNGPSFYTWDENCECTPPSGCSDESACNYNQPFTGFLAADIVGGGYTVVGAYEDPPFCLSPGDSCNVLNEMSAGPSPIGYSGVLDAYCECVCTNPENIVWLEYADFNSPIDVTFGLDSCPEEGCIDILACNYNSDAFIDDGSCFYPDDCGSCDTEITCSCGELTYVPDDNLEAYLENNIEGASNGVENDDYVITDALQVEPTMLNYEINLTAPFLGGLGLGLIADFTGIEAFQGNFSFNIDGHLATTIDLSCLKLGSAPAAFANPNNITISNCPLLEEIILPQDTITNLVISNNISLSNVIFHEETAIRTILSIDNCNNLCELNFKGKLVGQPLSSNGNPLTIVTQVSLYSNNNLAQVDLSELNEVVLGSGFIYGNTENSVQVNMNNEWLTYWGGVSVLGYPESVVNINSPYGGCIDVSNPNWCELSNYWINNDGMIYENGCYNPIDCDDNFHVTDHSLNRILFRKIDILGRETNNQEGFQLHIYDDGSIEKKYILK